ncbi:MAG: hypothetical protein ACI4RM_03880 [Ruminococcus sp.]
MNGNDLLNMMENVDSKFIEESEIYTEKKKTNSIKWGLNLKRFGAIAACLCVAVTAVLLSVNFYANKEKPTAAKADNSPVKYTDLMLPKGEDNNISNAADSQMSIVAFDESFLKEDGCCMIVEGTVKNIYSKKYKYDVRDDKFEENGVLHNYTETVVYEILVDKTWFGKDVTGQIITVEDNSYCLDPVFKIKAGRKYVVPIYEYGNSVLYNSEEEGYISGNITRESKYSSIYPYHPQIEVTEDNKYVFPDDWKTFMSENPRKVIVDDVDGYFDMYLLESENFEKAMEKLIDNMQN